MKINDDERGDEETKKPQHFSNQVDMILSHFFYFIQSIDFQRRQPLTN